MEDNLSNQGRSESAQSAHNDSKPYRVLMIAPTSFFADYGCHVRILEEARVLQSLGHEVTIATYHNGRDLSDIHIERTLPIPWRTQYEVGSSRHKIAFDALLGWKTLTLLVRNHYDVIHAHLHEGALIGHVLGRLTRTPVVFDFQGSLTEEMLDHGFVHRDSSLFGTLRRLETWIDRRSKVIFTSSTHAESILISDFRVNEKQIRALPDCVNTDVFLPADRQDQLAIANLRNAIGLPEDAKVIVYLGLLAAYQGTDLLLEAFQRILAEHDDVFLLLMGFPGVLYYQMKADTLGVRDHVLFTGRVPYEEAPLHLALGDVAVAPKLSLTESSGKLLNYMAMAMPTVAFETPVAREYLGDDGVYALQGDPVSLAEKLCQVLYPPENDDSVSGQADRLRERAMELFNWRSAVGVILEAYRDVTSKCSGHEFASDAGQTDVDSNTNRKSKTRQPVSAGEAL